MFILDCAQFWICNILKKKILVFFNVVWKIQILQRINKGFNAFQLSGCHNKPLRWEIVWKIKPPWIYMQGDFLLVAPLKVLSTEKLI